eukprot:Em1040g1a
MAQVKSNALLLEYSLAWLHNLNPFAGEQAVTVLNQFVKNASDLKLPALASRGMLQLANLEVSLSKPPAVVLKSAACSERDSAPILGGPAPQLALKSSMLALQAGTCGMYGQRWLSLLYSQLQCHMMSCDSSNGEDSDQQYEAFCLCLGMTARHLADDGDYDQALALLGAAKNHFSVCSHLSYKLICCSMEELGLARARDMAAARLHRANIATHRAMYASALITMSEGSYHTALLETQRVLNAERRCHLLLAEMYSCKGLPVMGLPHALEGVAFCQDHHLGDIGYETKLTLALIQEFDPNVEGISSYLERMGLYFVANKIESERQVAVFLSLIGGKNYALLRDLLLPQQLKDVSLVELMGTLRRHFEPKPVVIAERFHFHRRSQGADESVAEYVAELRKLATHCRFGGYLEEALRDRLVCGLREESTQRALLTENELTLARALEIAQSREAVLMNAQRLKEPSLTVKKVTTRTDTTISSKCTRCGSSKHLADRCPFRQATCFKCNKPGHIARVCRSGGRPVGLSKPTSQPYQGRNTLSVDDSAEEESAIDNVSVFAVGTPQVRPIVVKIAVNGTTIEMEVDTGAAVSLVSERTWKQIRGQVKLRKADVVLRAYNHMRLKVLGEAELQVQYGGRRYELLLRVVKEDGPSLIGRDWLQQIKLDWSAMCHWISPSQSDQMVKTLMRKYADVFKAELGTMKGVKAKLVLKAGVVPRFIRPRPIPFALKEAVEQEIRHLEEQGILRRITHSSWAAPIVVVPKKDGRVRLCGDYKMTINQYLEVDRYPLPKPNDLFATLAGGQKFSKIDLSQAYQQLVLEEESCELVVINTHIGLFSYTRLPFGVASAPALFQRAMDSILQGIAGVICYIDDILVTGKDDAQHLQALEQVLSRLQEAGLTIQKNKCVFMAKSVEYLGHVVDAEGLHTTPEKLKAILEAPAPKDLNQMRSFLGLVNYYARFIPNLSTVLHPLNRLLRQDVSWEWDELCEEAFQLAKQSLASSRVLVHYDPTMPLKLAGDASEYGVGAVLSHVCPDGSERPVAFASRTLSSSERNYAQLEKEALSLIFGVRKFHQQVFLPWLLLDFKGGHCCYPHISTIEYRSTACHANADGLSRLPLQSTGEEEDVTAATVFNVAQLESLPVTAEQLRAATGCDQILGKVLLLTQKGWPTKVNDDLKPYWIRRDEITIESGCLLWGVRVLVPKKLQGRVLEELHKGHPGASRMKSLARGYLWWPGLDTELEHLAKSCIPCQEVKLTPPAAPLHPWVWPSLPWQRIHVDFAGPFLGQQFLIVVDAHSKWPEVIPMASSTTAARTIEALRLLFASYGVPNQLVSDNGPQFVSKEFADFMAGNAVKHIRVAPYHPASNGLAERFVQTFKKAMSAARNDGASLSQKLCRFLLTYRSTPHATTQVAPCELFLKRTIRTRLDAIRPNYSGTVCDKQALQKELHDRHARSREFEIGQKVMAKNFLQGPPWVAGVISECKGPLTYLVEVEPHVFWRRHVDHIKHRHEAESVTPTEDDHSITYEDSLPENSAKDASNEKKVTEKLPSPDSKLLPSHQAVQEPVVPVVVEPDDGKTGSSKSTATTPKTVTVPEMHSQQPRYPMRQRKPPDYYGRGKQT